MNTLTSIIRELLRRGKKPDKNPDKIRANKTDNDPDRENQPIYQLQKPKENETETDEIPGDPRLDNSTVEESDGSDSKEPASKSTDTERCGRNRGDGGNGNGESVNPEPEAQEESAPKVQEESAPDSQEESAPESHEKASPEAQEGSVPEASVTDEETIQQRIRKAYEEGLIAGRNAAIEEKYFPKKDDGIPVFHGKSSKRMPGSDIFSMAREA